MFEKIAVPANLADDPIADQLISLIEQLSVGNQIDENITVYHNYPSFYAPNLDRRVAPNVLVVGKKIGVTIFQCVSSEDIAAGWEEREELLGEIDRTLYAQILKLAPEVVRGGRSLKCEFRRVFFGSELTDAQESSRSAEYDYLTSAREVKSYLLNGNDPIGLDDQGYDGLRAAIDGSKSIKKPIKRPITDPILQKLGHVLNEVEGEISRFDSKQRKTALVTLDGPVRIRGLAGSGKTVILARKAALIHEQRQDAKILFTYNTKALGGHIKALITRFYREGSDQDPNWENIHIMHAWGGAGLDGVYHNACKSNGVTPINLFSAKQADSENPFDYVCKELVTHDISPRYDYCLIDEAQDFPKHFYRLCDKLTRGRKVVWAYDDFQNILDIQLQNERETFGTDPSGNYLVDFDRQAPNQADEVLSICYRNPRLILVTAFSLGLGIYSTSGQVQRLSSNQHWSDLGFEVEQGGSNPGDQMVISRPVENSSPVKNKYLSNPEEVIEMMVASSIDEECEFISDSIAKDVESGLQPQDISIICLDWLTIGTYLRTLTSELLKKGIRLFDVYKLNQNSVNFQIEGCVTFSTVHKAKGNESGKVYVIGVDKMFRAKDSAPDRSKLFTAITRAKGWIVLTGIGNFMQECVDEYEALKNNGFKLKFIQPSEEDIRTIAYEISDAERKKARWRDEMEETAKQLGISYEDLLEQLKA